MLVLLFDTSTPFSTIGWVRFRDDHVNSELVEFASVFMPARPGHAEVLLDRISASLASGGYSIKDVGLIVHGLGPGTFTGLRIGMSTVKAFHLSSGIPSVGLSTLAIQAASARCEGTVVSLVDARRSELYVGAYRVEGTDDTAVVEPLMDECVLPLNEVIPALASASISGPYVFAGNGATVYRDMFEGAGTILPIGRLPFDVTWMARAGVRRFRTEGPDDPGVTEPVYLRAPDAKLPGEKK